jgi:hypothetical protein
MPSLSKIKFEQLILPPREPLHHLQHKVRRARNVALGQRLWLVVWIALNLANRVARSSNREAPTKPPFDATSAFSFAPSRDPNRGSDSDAVRLMRAAADEGDPQAKHNLARCYELGFGGVVRDEDEAARLFKLAADQGYAAAQHYLGVCYHCGLNGLTKDDREATRLFRLAAEQGHMAAKEFLSTLFSEELSPEGR